MANEKDLKIVTNFIKIYCGKEHSGKQLCAECADLLTYATKRLEKCPYDPKPKCKDCKTHCYAPNYRQRIQAVMRFSGLQLVTRGRLDWLFKYFLAGQKH